ncbi:hypothetical protein L0222_09485 [bacterium]|nr:hypothetical protein [bacterium]MCI0603082.1 hypothetical protein [bacterium]
MSWLKDALERRTVWPYQLAAEPVKLEIAATALTGKTEVAAWKASNWRGRRGKAGPPEPSKVVDASARWDLFTENIVWDRLQLRCTASIDGAERFPASAVSFGLVALCKNTRYRSAARGSFNTGAAEMVLTIQRNDVSGQILLLPVLVLINPRRAPAGFPDVAGARLATGFPVTIFTDAPAERPGGGIEIQWRNFGPQFRDSLFELAIAPPEILLRLNNEHSALKAIVEDLSKTGNRARIRNAIFALIACDVWFQLAEFAAHEMISIEEPEDATSELAVKILKSLSKMIRIPHQEIVQSYDDPAGRAMLSVRIQHALKSGTYQNALITGSVSDEEGFAL